MKATRRPARIPQPPSPGEAMLALHIAAHGLPAPVREHVFAAPRRWRFDFAWPDRMIAVEVEGGTMGRSRHTSGAGYRRDCEKYSEAAVRGWCVLRVTTAMVREGVAIELVQRSLWRHCARP